ncbi:MAG TPA: DUF6600 domain-containing protein [Steroidobacter sp.]|nr:DUF6600 domain-containing protein [Steroidobacter sp.]
MNRDAPSTRWLIVLIALAGAISATANAQDDEVDPPGRVARLSLIDGEVSFAPAGTEEWAEAVLNRPITSEDRLSVGVNGRAELQVGSAAIYLDQNTQFGFIELDDDVMQMSLVEGAATIRVRQTVEHETIKVETPNAAVQLRTVGEYHIEVDPKNDRTVVKTRSGEAEATGGSQRYTVGENEQVVFSGLESLSAQISSIPPRTPFEAWAHDRDRRANQAESARYVSRDMIGYEDLDDQGEWLHDREYGHVWRPLYVVDDWAPYRFGRWAWVSPWGWTWIDDARWGFAPFHYGRWVSLHHRWCWVPGPRHLRPLYAPALVAWIGGPSASVSVSFGGGIGWYPLAPYEVYVPGYRYTPRYIRQVNVSNTVILNNAYITNVYSRDYAPHHRYRGHAHAVTAVQRDEFVGGRPIGGRRVRLSQADVHRWRDDPRPPAITPYRESVLAGAPRENRYDSPASRQARERVARRVGAERVDFTAERRAIENNGGRPVSRSRLLENPKGRGDFRPAGPTGDVKGRNLEGVERSNETPGIIRRSGRLDAQSLDRSARDHVRGNDDTARMRGQRVSPSEHPRQADEPARAQDPSAPMRSRPPTQRLHSTTSERLEVQPRVQQGIRAERVSPSRSQPAPRERDFAPPRERPLSLEPETRSHAPDKEWSSRPDRQSAPVRERPHSSPAETRSRAPANEYRSAPRDAVPN